MNLNIVDKHNVAVPFEGFVLIRTELVDLRKGSIYPFGRDDEGNVLALDDAKELQTLDRNDYLIYEEGARYVTVKKGFLAHRLTTGSITRAYDNLVDRDINTGCVWVKSFSNEHDYFAIRENNLADFKRVLWTAQAYRYRMQAAQLSAAPGKIMPGSGVVTGRFVSVAVDAPKFQPFTAEEPLTRYVTVEFSPGGKNYTYLLPNHLTAMKGDDAVVVVNNPNYPELKGTKVVRITGVYDRNPSDYYDNSLKRIEHVVSKSAERRKELEQKINDKRIQLRQAEKRVATVADQLTKLEEDLVNGTY